MFVLPVLDPEKLRELSKQMQEPSYDGSFFVPQSAGKQQIGNKHGSGNQQNSKQTATHEKHD